MENPFADALPIQSSSKTDGIDELVEADDSYAEGSDVQKEMDGEGDRFDPVTSRSDGDESIFTPNSVLSPQTEITPRTTTAPGTTYYGNNDGHFLKGNAGSSVVKKQIQGPIRSSESISSSHG